jgi:tubulin beta
MGRFFSPDSFIHAQNGAGNNWAKGYYSEGSELVEPILDQVRKHAEACEALNGFQLTHSLGGGTGSGLGSNILNKLEQDYPNRILFNYSVMPGSASKESSVSGIGSVSDIVVEPYNTMFALNQLINTSHMSTVLENSALYKICTNILKVQSPSFADINYIATQAMCSSTATMRFPGASNNSDLRKLCVNLIPFPRLHFISQAQAPLLSRSNAKYFRVDEKEIMSQLFDSRAYMSSIDLKYGRILTGSVLFRGAEVSSGEVEAQIKRLSDKHSS